MVAGLDLLIPDLFLERFAVDIELRARAAWFRDLEQRPARADYIADAQVAVIQSLGSEIFAQSTRKERVPAAHQFDDYFGSNDKDSFERPTMNLRMCVKIACKAEGVDESFRDRTLGKSARRDADLENGRLQIRELGARSSKPAAGIRGAKPRILTPNF